MNLFLKDKIVLGLILGFITPLIGFTVFYFARFHLFSLKEYCQVLLMERPLLSGVITISLVANVFIFTISSISNTTKPPLVFSLLRLYMVCLPYT